MASEDAVWAPASEVVILIRSLDLKYPIVSKAEFITMMSRSKQPVIFRGKAFEASYGASLVPDFFFPVTSEEDLILKVSELLMARGLLPLPSRP